MPILFMLFISALFSCISVWGSQIFRQQNRSLKINVLLFVMGCVTGCAASVLAECLLRAGRPTFYYQTHPVGWATVKLFASADFCAAVFYTLFLMIFERHCLRGNVLCWTVRSLLIAFCAALILEIGYFNFRHFELIGTGAKEVTLYPENFYGIGFYFNRASWRFHTYDSQTYGLTSYLQPLKIRNISFDFEDGSNRTPIRILYNDRAHREQEPISVHEFVQGISRSYLVPIHTVGMTDRMTIQFPEVSHSGEAEYSLSLNQVTLNKKVPLEIQPVRMAIIFFAVFLIVEFFPGSPLWTLPLNIRTLPQRISTLLLLILFSGVFVWTVFSSYTGQDGTFSEQKARLNPNYEQYNWLTDALLSRSYAITGTSDTHMEQLSDPYDAQSRDRLNFYYPRDTVYYQGKYYVYFGVVPVLTVFMPWKLITGNYLELDYAALFFALFFMIGLYGVYRQIVLRYYPKISFALYELGLILLVTPLNVTWCLRRGLVYELAILSGICWMVWGIFFILRGSEHSLSWFASGTASALAVGCRPTMLLISPVVMAVGFFTLRAEQRLFCRKNLLRVLLFLLPYIAIGLAFMKYNYERFDNPLEFGITYQLTNENRATGLPLLDLDGRLFCIWASLFNPPEIDLEFPFIHFIKAEIPYAGSIQDDYEILGIFWYPILSFVFLLPWMHRKIKQKSELLAALCWTSLISAAAICWTASSYCTANRYLADYGFLLALPSLCVLFCCWEKAAEKNWTQPLQMLVLVFCICGTALFLAASVSGEGNWLKLINPFYEEKLRYAFSPWL